MLPGQSDPRGNHLLISGGSHGLQVELSPMRLATNGSKPQGKRGRQYRIGTYYACGLLAPSSYGVISKNHSTAACSRDAVPGGTAEIPGRKLLF